MGAARVALASVRVFLKTEVPLNKTYLRIGVPVGLAAIIAAVLLGVFLSGGDETPAPEANKAASEAPSEQKSAAPADVSSKPEIASVTDGETATPSDPAAAAPARAKPTFDVVRINPKGGTVMAGRAEPGAEVIITDGERELGRVTANDQGEWVFSLDKPMEPGDRQLSLKDATGGGIESEQVVVVSVPERKDGKEQQALAVLQPREGGSSVVLQLPEEEKRDASGEPRTTVGSVDYSTEGEISVSGRTDPGAALNIYIDNQLAGRAKADEQGRWTFAPGDALGDGPHQMRVDSVDPVGQVVSRAETPISRSSREKLTAGGDTVVVVQPGNSLWRIARRTYGGGIHYSEIYQANRDQIRDPNLIYPGQILRMPPRG